MSDNTQFSNDLSSDEKRELLKKLLVKKAAEDDHALNLLVHLGSREIQFSIQSQDKVVSRVSFHFLLPNNRSCFLSSSNRILRL